MSERGELTQKAVIRALSHEMRWRILRELLAQPLPVTVLAGRLGKPVGLVSRHMGVLRAAGVVERGLGAIYAVRPALVVEGGVDRGHALVRFPGPQVEGAAR
ncbi:MAG: helix-turn-helix domain-containing protein [Terrimicrobiaceae bacterium]|nr:helix-turn-helix domain-containing protein [Terrimicrobiaceae bacterium]